MEQTLYIVICRGYGPWMLAHEGVFTERRLAENYVELKKVVGNSLEYAIVEGPITNPRDMRQAELALGAF